MKTNAIIFSLISSMTLGAFAQTSGGGSGSGTVGAGQPARPSNPNQAMPGVQNRELQPGLQNRDRLAPGVQSTTTTNSFVSTNQPGMNPNQFQGTNNLTPTGNTSGTN